VNGVVDRDQSPLEWLRTYIVCRCKSSVDEGTTAMKPLLCAAAILAATSMLGTPAQAQNYPWCAQYSGGALGGAMNCGLVSFQQCLATVSGIGGFCVRNTLYQPPAGPQVRRRYYPY
jgi:hypothetical protein